MIDVRSFVFDSFWCFVGTIVLIGFIGETVAYVVRAAREKTTSDRL